MVHLRRSLALGLALGFGLIAASPLPAEEPQQRLSLWQKISGKKQPRGAPEDAGPLGTLRRKLAEAKAERQQAAKFGAEPAELRRMDARIAGIEELAELIGKRQDMVRAGTPRTQIAEVDRRILEVRQGLRKVGHPSPIGAARFRANDLWNMPHPNTAGTYQAGDLRKSMGI